ncbi:MAG: M48 family metallopeptidase [Gammaproteobacteria bacterium]|nr:M48 family metallopeptidase [Gammaproteobacteria bacterium]
MNTSYNIIELDDIRCDVIYKDIKNVHLSVHPPQGRVTISAPLRMDLETIRLFSISKLGWIRKQQARFKSQKREAPREYITRESHYYLGRRYLLKVVEQDAAPKVVLKHNTIELYVRKNALMTLRKEVLQGWYRQQLRELILHYIVNLEKKMNVKVAEICIRTMKTKWGTCNPKAKRIWLNTELAKKPIENIEYVLIHEMVHLLERNHNEKFIAYMDKFLPKWQHMREELNRSALGYAEWSC